MSRRVEDILYDLASLPWWVSVCLSIIVYIGMKFGGPAMFAGQGMLQGIIGDGISKMAGIVAIIFLIPAPISFLNSLRKRKLLDRQDGIESIRALPWKEFEELLAEAYRRQGYSVRENSSLGPDGGVDLELEKGGSIYLVQCKQWRDQKVPVHVIREMFGVMTAQRASGVHVVTSGMFTQEAKNFAAGKPIDLIEGNVLAKMIRNVQAGAGSVRSLATTGRRCLRCNGQLVLRTARRGDNIGSKFWGCTGYPNCNYTEPHKG
ncbi:MAG: restriction endonuclease [candidate division NC10 bacterium]|nr:restriction endonuclease [candidate division NC10 bacterium]MDE2320813.1 restriction endonuclease [candidate division NC10 bacterium]